MPPDSCNEADTDRNGFLSTRREIHATAIGLAVGLATGLTNHYELGALFVFAALGTKLGGLRSEALAEIRTEPWYALAAFALATVVGIALA